jgi:hypothetical protein
MSSYLYLFYQFHELALDIYEKKKIIKKGCHISKFKSKVKQLLIDLIAFVKYSNLLTKGFIRMSKICINWMKRLALILGMPPPLIRHFCNTKLPTLAQVTLFLGMLTIFFF